MSTPIAPLSNGDRLTKELDGRRSTAPGMPLVDEGKYAKEYGIAMKLYGHNLNWTSDQWETLYKELSTRTHCVWANSEGFMAAIWDMFIAAIDRELRRYSVTTAREKLKSELGPREFTLTYSPAWYKTDDEAQNAMRVAIDKLTRYYKDEINEFRAVGEYTKAGRSHVHCYYLLDGGRKITDKNFKRAWSHWNPRKKMGDGFEGGHHATIRKFSDFSGYVEKDLKDAWMNIHIKNADYTQDGTQDSGSCASGGSSGSGCASFS